MHVECVCVCKFMCVAVLFSHITNSNRTKHPSYQGGEEREGFQDENKHGEEKQTVNTFIYTYSFNIQMGIIDYNQWHIYVLNV